MLRLSDQEKQDVIRYLEADRPLPDKYRFLLFADKREVQLVWNGKSNDVCNVVLPFQIIEHADEPRAEKPEDTSAVELADFSVFFAQDSIAAAEAALSANRKGGSRIVVEQGQVVKVSRNADGTVSREALTRHWTDWIDYWSVDFDFESKREIIRVKAELSPDEQSTFDGMGDTQQKLVGWEEQWTGDYVFENE